MESPAIPIEEEDHEPSQSVMERVLSWFGGALED